MGFKLNTTDGAIDLGPALEFLRAVRELGTAIADAKADDQYPTLLMVAHMGDQELDEEAFRALQGEAKEAQAAFRLGEHTEWMLGQIADAVYDSDDEDDEENDEE